MSWYRETFFPWVEARFSRSLGRYKQRLLGTCSGEVLEIGFGTGLSLPHYPASVSRLSAIEPNPGMRKHADLGSVSFDVRLEQGVAEALPFAEASFDNVVSLLTLCSVQDLQKTIQEIQRVLRPGGQFFFLEHTAQSRGVTLGLQRAIQPLWGKIACGCHIDRETVGSLKMAGFDLRQLESIGYSGFPNILAPLYLGIALRG